MELDLIIRGGTVVDGSGSPRRTADVGIAGDSIEVIDALNEAQSRDVIYAEGLVVAPGFVDIHSHSDFTLLVDPRAQSSVYQGVTTELVGNCGHGCAPITDPHLFTGNIYGYDPGTEMTWRTFSEYLEALDSARPAINVASLVPNGNLRIAVMGFDERPASPDEIEQMTNLLEEGLEAGAFGYSTGLESSWERMASHRETVDLCGVAARYEAMYACHTRNKEVEAVEAVEETVQVARDSGVRCQVSHIIPRRGGPADARVQAIAVLEEGYEEGLDVAFDAHTRLHGITNLSAALPSPFLEKSTADRQALLVRRLRSAGTSGSIPASFRASRSADGRTSTCSAPPRVPKPWARASRISQVKKGTVGTPSWTSSPAKSSRSSTRWSSATPTPRKSFATPSSIRYAP